MAQINSCLKCVFAMFNILFAIFGGLTIVLALMARHLINVHGEEKLLQGHTAGLIYLYIIGGNTMIIAILGAYGALTENKRALIVFLVFMIGGALSMFRLGAFFATNRIQVKNVVEDPLHTIVPLDNSPEKLQNVIHAFQKEFHCCGLFSYTDWNQLPDSCMCDQQDVKGDECQSVGYPREYIYTKTCYPIIEYYILLVFDIVIGVAFTIGSIALLGMILSSIMIHQMRY